MADSKALRAQLEVVELEEAWVAAKSKKGFDRDKPENKNLRHDLKKARRKAREQREVE